MSAHSDEVTLLLKDWGAGNPEALEQLAPLVYGELHRLAHHLMRRERKSRLLQTTALVHEAFLRLVKIDLDCDDRHHFFRIAARQMRRVLVDDARKRQAGKRGGGAQDLSLEHVSLAVEPSFDILAIDDALDKLAAFDARKAEIVELRFFGGLTVREITELRAVSRGTVERDLKLAKAWLRRTMSGSRELPS